MLNFKPQTEEQINGLLNPGVYSYTVKSAENTHSKASNKPMIKLILQIWDKDGREHIIYDNLLESLAYKLKHFCEGTGLDYMSGKLDASDCIGKSGTCKIKTEPAKGDYPAKNVVQDYLKSQAVVQAQAVQGEAFQDSDIPF